MKKMNSYKVEMFRGKPTILVNGKPHPAYTYFYTLDVAREDAERMHRHFAEQGC